MAKDKEKYDRELMELREAIHRLCAATDAVESLLAGRKPSPEEASVVLTALTCVLVELALNLQTNVPPHLLLYGLASTLARLGRHETGELLAQALVASVR